MPPYTIYFFSPPLNLFHKKKNLLKGLLIPILSLPLFTKMASDFIDI